MGKVMMIMAGLMLGLVSAALALDLNPVHWVTGGEGVYGLLVLALGWAFKLKLDALKLKTAVRDIKGAVDEVRKSCAANSPGGNKVVIGEARAIAADSLTAILSTLRALPVGWIPHWVRDEGEGK